MIKFTCDKCGEVQYTTEEAILKANFNLIECLKCGQEVDCGYLLNN